MVIISYLKRKLSCIFSRKSKGSFVLESVLVFPFVVLFLIFISGVFNYFYTASFIDHRVDAFGSYVASVGAGEVEFEGFSFDLVSFVSDDVLSAHLLKGGFLKEDRLFVGCDMSEGYLVVSVRYKVSLLFFGDVFFSSEYERRLWS